MSDIKFAGFSLRPKNGKGDFYNPDRDLSVIAARVLPMLAASFNEDKWPGLVEAIYRDNTLPDEEWNSVCRVNDATFKILSEFNESSEFETFETLLTRVGWDELDERAKALYMAVLGHLMLSYMVAALKSEVPMGEGPSEATREALNMARSARIAFMDITPEADLCRAVADVVECASINGVPSDKIKDVVNKKLATLGDT
jgi:hypothetical protein